MIRLKPGQTLEALLAGAVATTQPTATVCFSDKTSSDYSGDSQDTSFNGVTVVTVCAAPATGAIRDVDLIVVRNHDTASVTLTLRRNISGTPVVLLKVTLKTGEQLQYTHGEGFRVMAADGSVKTSSTGLDYVAENVANKNVSDGYVGLSGFTAILKSAGGSIASFLASAATVARTWTFPDKSGTVAMTSDIITDHTGLSSIGTNTHAQIDTHIASTANPHSVTKAQVGLGNADDTSDVNKPVSTAQAASDASVLSTAQSYADGLVVGLLDDRGNFDASGNAWPTTGGSGSASAINKGDLWTISVAGVLGGHTVTAGDVIRALTDAPGSTDANWAIAENNFGYVAENSANKNASGGYAGLTLFKLNLVNALGTVTSWFTTAATVARTWTMPDKDGTVAMTSDITATAVGLNNLTNDAQTKAAIVPNTAPSAGQVLVGNAGGTAYAPVALSGPVSITAAGVTSVAALNQNTTGSAATLTTSRNIDGQAFNGSADITVIAPGTHAATSKATPVDADEVPLVDSAASNALKKLTWANLKATLKTYLDTLYQVILVSGTNIKTINSTSLLGAGDITLSASPGGSNTQLQYNSSSSFAGAAGLTTDGNVLTNTQAVAASSTDGYVLVTSVAATVGAQKLSPRVRWTGSGWKTTATAGAQAVDFIAEVRPVQGTTAPSGALFFAYQINAGGYTDAFSVNTSGTIVGRSSASATTPQFGAASGENIYVAASGGGTSVTLCSNTGTFFSTSGTVGATIRSDGRYAFSSGTTLPDTSPDGGFARDAAGILKVTDGGATNLRDLKLRALWHGSYLTVGTLPTASSSEGYEVNVNDSLAPSAGSTVSSGGSAKCKVRSNAANWVVIQVF